MRLSGGVITAHNTRRKNRKVPWGEAEIRFLGKLLCTSYCPEANHLDTGSKYLPTMRELVLSFLLSGKLIYQRHMYTVYAN